MYCNIYIAPCASEKVDLSYLGPFVQQKVSIELQFACCVFFLMLPVLDYEGIFDSK